MPSSRNASRAFLLAAFVLFMAAGLHAQGRFTVNGRMKVEGSDLSGARAVVYKNGVKERTITTGLTKFSLELDLNANYIVSFEKDGYVAKKISFNTHAPAEAAAKGFTPFDFAVSLFKQYDDINLVVFNQPVGMIRYDPAAGDFDYDTDYTKSIHSQLQEATQRVERKQKEEQQAAAQAEKQKAEDAKAQAKARAEADKQAAAQAAADAKAKAEAEKQAAAQAAAEAKAKAEADKQAAAQAAAEAKRQAEAERQAKAEQARQEAAQREAEKQRPAQAVKTEAPKPVAPTPPAPKPEKPIPPAPAPQRATLAAEPVKGHDGRRRMEPVMAEEPSRVERARPQSASEERPAAEHDEPVVNRTEDLIVEAGKVTTVVRIEVDGKATEYRRVFHKWGGTFFFKDGQACSQVEYDSAVRTEQLAGATPRGKLD
jgi:hypothetical protein